MFDYQAGEKYKITLAMTGIAGLIIGMFFTLLIMPQSSEPPRNRGNHGARVASNAGALRDSGYVEGVREYNKKMKAGTDEDDSDINPISASNPNSNSSQAQAMEVSQAPNPTSESVGACDVNTASTLIERWLPLSWDLSAASAKFSQEKAISYMTNQCASQYRKHIWTKNISDQIASTGIVSHFKLISLKASQPNTDGSVTIYVEAEQELDIPGKGSKARDLSVQYLVIQTSNGPRIASITAS